MPTGDQVPGRHREFFVAAISWKVCRIASFLLLMPLFGISLDSAAGQSAIPKLVFSPWTKFCPTGGDASGKHVCQTAKLGHTESGQPIVAAILTEPQGNAKKILRVVVPIGMQILRGSRLIVDDGQPVGAPYIGCFSKGCMADYEAKAVPDRFESAGFPKDNG